MQGWQWGWQGWYRGWWVLLSTCPLHRAIWLAAALGNLPGSSPAGTLAGYRAGLAGASAESGAQSPSWGSVGWCQPLSQAAVGGQGRQRWHGVLAGVGGCMDPVSLASPSRVSAHRMQVWHPPTLSKQGLVCRRWRQEHVQLLSPPASHCSSIPGMPQCLTHSSSSQICPQGGT